MREGRTLNPALAHDAGFLGRGGKWGVGTKVSRVEATTKFAKRALLRKEVEVVQGGKIG
jgi:hypothetical protein